MAKKSKKKNKNKLVEQVRKDQVTTPGISATAGTVSNPYDENDYQTLIDDYTKMRDGGAISSTSLEILKLPIQQADFFIKEGRDTEISKEARDYVQWAYEQLYDGHESFIYHLTLALDYGVSVFEKVMIKGVEYVRPDGVKKTTNIIGRLAPMHPARIYGFYYDEIMDLDYIDYDREGQNGSYVRIPIDKDKLFLYTHRKEFGDTRGRSELRTARMSWKIKQSVFISGARATSRGAGIPEIKIKGAVTTSKINDAQKIGETVGNTDNAYIITSEDIDFELHDLQSQDNVEKLLDYCNREMFFNTLSEFVTSGIGGNGSRASTSEHKSAYELKANSTLKGIETQINRLICEMVRMSYLGDIADEDMPLFSFQTIGTLDTKKLVDSVKQLYDIGVLDKREDDEQFFRDVLDMPRITETATISEVVESEDDKKTVADEEIDTEKQLSHKHSMPDYALNHIQNVFSLESANVHFDTMKERARAVVDDIVHRMLIDFGKQIDINKDRDLDIRYTKELVRKLEALYKEGLEKGRKDIMSEFKKIGVDNIEGTKLSVKLADIPKGTKTAISKKAVQLQRAIAAMVEDKMAVVSLSWLTKNGGGLGLSLAFDESHKGLRNATVSRVTEAYTDGRAEVMTEAEKTMKVVYLYTVSLENPQNICDTCAPIDGELMTLDEAEEMNIQKDSPVNMDCLGGGLCKCQLTPFEVWSLDELNNR